MKEYIIYFFISFFVTFFTVPVLIRRLKQVKICGIDMNKEDHCEIPEMGGFAVVAGFLTAILFKITISRGTELTELLACVSSILIVTIVGIVDDLFDIEQRIKAMLPLLAALPLIVIKAGTTDMYFPIIGPVELGYWYVIFFIPMGVTGAANAYNMLGGINGLETGMGFLSCATLFFCAIIANRPVAASIMVCMMGALLAFYYYNKYPSKIFPGDICTLTIGCSLAAASIVGNMERVGILVTLLYFGELFLKAKTRFKGQSFGKITDHGLDPPKQVASLTHIAMKFTHSERNIAYLLFFAQGIMCLIAFSTVYFSL